MIVLIRSPVPTPISDRGGEQVPGQGDGSHFRQGQSRCGQARCAQARQGSACPRQAGVSFFFKKKSSFTAAKTTTISQHFISIQIKEAFEKAFELFITHSTTSQKELADNNDAGSVFSRLSSSLRWTSTLKPCYELLDKISEGLEKVEDVS